jgi:hypothetical protein
MGISAIWSPDLVNKNEVNQSDEIEIYSWTSSFKITIKIDSVDKSVPLVGQTQKLVLEKCSK